MPDARSNARDLDLVLFGATGFTGALTADYLAEHGPQGLRWGLAGRSIDKLEKERDRLGLPDLELVVADSGDPASLADLARRTKVVVTTVGPYVDRGEALAGACADAGTDYCDITGEGEFVDRVYVAHHATAVSTGARLVHCCGFDSIPHDLGALYTVEQLPRDVPITVRGVVRAGGLPSGGTFETALTGMSRVRQIRAAAAARRRLEKRPADRSSRAIAGRPGKDPVLGYWLLPLPTIDPAIVARSGAALAEYGPEFRYSHYAGMKTLPYAVGGAAVVAGLGMASQLKLARDFLMKRYPAGDGPDEARREKSWFSVDFVGEGGGERVHTRVSGGDPGYSETAMMLAESALSLAFDTDNPDVAGQVTTAQAMGANLTRRVRAGGLTFTTVSAPRR
jgi:saccharopine dehydrogenase (NAD+, L-glutamate forming)